MKIRTIIEFNNLRNLSKVNNRAADIFLMLLKTNLLQKLINLNLLLGENCISCFSCLIPKLSQVKPKTQYLGGNQH